MKSFFSDDFYFEGTLDETWVSPCPSSVRTVLNYAQACGHVETSIGGMIWIEN